jgi:hypothetical protein
MSDVRWSDPREYGERDREDRRPRVYNERDRDDPDPRDGLMRDLDLPRGEERELVVDCDRVYELNGEDGRTLAAVGAFRIVPEHDLDIDHETLDHLRDEGLVDVVDLGDDERGLTLTNDGRDLLDAHSMDGAMNRRRRFTQASAALATSTTMRVCTRRISRRNPASETSTATSTSGASSSSRT